MTEPVRGHFHRHVPTAEDQQTGVADRIMAGITRRVGTLACAVLFCLIALISLPAAIKSGQPIVIVAWVAQTFLQLVLLSIILGGQGVSEKANEAQTKHIASGIDTTLDRLDPATEGGLQVIADGQKAILDALAHSCPAG